MSTINSAQGNVSGLQRLYHNPEITEVVAPPLKEVVDMRDVDMDCYAITKRGRIATSGIHTCFAVCCQGRRKNGQAILGLAHVSTQSIHTVCQTLFRKLEKKGCDRATMKTYVVGGMPICEDGISSSLEQEQEALAHVREDHIVGVRFNVVKGGQESLSLIFTPDHVRFSKEDLFLSTETIGTQIEDDLA